MAGPVAFLAKEAVIDMVLGEFGLPGQVMEEDPPTHTQQCTDQRDRNLGVSPVAVLDSGGDN
ncbi:MAG TPA: hypothetical protein VF788_12110 [Pseudonocardiaceae bacterium]